MSLHGIICRISGILAHTLRRREGTSRSRHAERSRDGARTIFRRALLVLVAAAWQPTSANGDYDVARDFSVSGNPSPPWSYGSSATLGSAFNVYPVFSRGSVDQWSFGGLPNVWHNASTATVQQATNFTPPGGFGLHPGSGGEYSVVRWTAPADGTFRITGYFMGLDSSYPTTTDVRVVLNNNVAAPLFSGYISTYNQPLNFSFDVTTAGGDTIDFAVGVGGNGFFGDATGLAALIAPLTPPSPLVVTNTNDIGTGSLREAINFLNANCAAPTITFDIPGTGVKTIHPASALPAITCSHAAIDGYSQPGSSKNSLAVGDNAVLLIELSGDLAGVSHGIAINTDSVAVSGLVINRFSGSGIQILAPINTVGSVALGNFIGTDPSGPPAWESAAWIPATAISSRATWATASTCILGT